MGHISDSQLTSRMAAYPAAARAAGIFHSDRRGTDGNGQCRDCHFMTTCAICPGSDWPSAWQYPIRTGFRIFGAPTIWFRRGTVIGFRASRTSGTSDGPHA